MRNCADDDKVELFYLYDIVFNYFKFDENDIQKLKEGAIYF